MPAPVHLITALIRISFIFWFSFLPFYGILLFLFTAGHSYPMLLSCRFFPVVATHSPALFPHREVLLVTVVGL